jgi:hypothetical protein
VSAFLWSGALLMGICIGLLWSLLPVPGWTGIPVGVLAGVFIATVLFPTIGEGRRRRGA